MEKIDITWKLKKEEAKRWISEKYNNVKTFAMNNPELAIAIGTGIAGAASWIIKTATRRSNIREERRLKERYVYDRSVGAYYTTRRKLNGRDLEMIDRRKKMGEPLGSILRDMNLI